MQRTKIRRYKDYIEIDPNKTLEELEEEVRIAKEKSDKLTEWVEPD